MMCLILSKLGENLREKSNRTVLNIRRRHLRDPDFADLIHFVVDEATLANNVLFSKDALSGYLDRKEAPSKRWQLKTYLTTAKEKSGRSKDVCYLCQNDHDLDKCQDCNKVNSSFKRSCVMDVICQYQQMIIYGAVNKGQCVILVVKNIQLVYMAIKIVRKKKMHLVATHRRVIAL